MFNYLSGFCSGCLCRQHNKTPDCSDFECWKNLRICLIDKLVIDASNCPNTFHVYCIPCSTSFWSICFNFRHRFRLKCQVIMSSLKDSVIFTRHVALSNFQHFHSCRCLHVNASKNHSNSKRVELLTLTEPEARHEYKNYDNISNRHQIVDFLINNMTRHTKQKRSQIFAKQTPSSRKREQQIARRCFLFHRDTREALAKHVYPRRKTFLWKLYESISLRRCCQTLPHLLITEMCQNKRPTKPMEQAAR